MMIDEAIRILDPESSKDALLPYAYDSHQRRKVVDEACRVAVDELRKQQWISVKGRMPEPNDRVLVYAPGMRDCDVGAIAIQSGWMCKNPNRGITHWQPLPEPPKEREENA